MEHIEIKEDVGRWQRMAWVVGAVGMLGSAAAYVTAKDVFFQSYLMAFWYWFCLAAGSLGFLLIHHLVAGRWGFVIQRPLEAAARTMPYMAVLFIPVILGMHSLYEWTHDEAKHDVVLQRKALYLNVPGFIGRAALFFVIWSALAYTLSAWSRRQEKGDAAALDHRIRTLAGPGLVAFVLTMTFASIDWGMSLTPHWFSTMYGPLFFVGSGLSTLAFMAILAHRVEHRKPFIHVITHQQFHDIGNLMFAFTIFWSYQCIGEYIIIWSGNMIEETEWFLRRSGHGWKIISYSLAVGQFFIPFLLLLNKPLKRHGKRLMPIALWVLAFRYIGIFWLVAPTFREHLQFHWADAATMAGVGGVWLALFLGQLKSTTFLPGGDPRFLAAQGEHVRGHIDHPFVQH